MVCSIISILHHYHFEIQDVAKYRSDMFDYPPPAAVLKDCVSGRWTWLLKNKVNIFCLFFSFVFTLPLAFTQNNQQANVKFIGVNSGLSHREVFAINHDLQGFVWFATRTGLDRYDGTDFLHFKYPDNYTKITNTVTNFKDQNEVFWLVGLGEKISPAQDSLGNKLLLFDLKNQVYLSWADYLGKKASFTWDDILDVTIIKDQAPVFYLVDGRRFIWAQNDFFLLPQSIRAKDLLITTESKVYYFQKTPVDFKLMAWNPRTEATSLIQRLEDPDRNNYHAVLKDSLIYLVQQTKQSYKYFRLQAENGLEKISEIPIKPASQIFPDFSGQATFLTQSNQLWMIREGRIINTSLNEKKSISFDVEPSIRPTANILDLHFGVLGNLWIGTRNGVLLYQFLETPFEKHLYNSSDQSIDNRISLRGILVQDQQLIANSYQGQFVVDLEDSRAQPDRRSSGIYYPIIEGSAGEQLFGWQELYRKIPGIEQPELITPDSSLGEIEIWSLQKDARQHIWLGLEKGLAVLRPQDSLIRAFTKYNDFPELQTATVNHFLEIDHKQYLLASSNGIFHLDIDRGIIARYHEGATDQQKLPFNQFNHIHRSEDGIFWLASAGAGLIRWDMESGVYQQYNLENGLSNEVLYFTYEDKRGFLWIGSDYGLIRFNKRYEELMVYLEKDGISHHEFNRIAHYQAADGTLYFGTINGVTAFNPLQILPKRQSDFPLVLTQLTQLSDGERKQSNIFPAGLPSLSIRPKDRLYRLDFRLLDYWGAERCKYAYKIGGFQEEWFELEEGGIMIPGMPFGNYTLQIRGQDSNGRLSETTLAIPIKVLKPWWQKPWVWLLFLLSLISGIIGFSFLRISRAEKSSRLLENLVQVRTEELQKDKKIIEQQSQELQQMSYLKSRFFVNIAHELRTPLTLLKGPISSVLKSNELGNRNFTMLAMAQNNLQKILQLIDEILDLGKLEEGKLKVEARPILLMESLNQMILNYSTLAQEKGVSLIESYQFPQELRLLVDAPKLERVLANLLSNAIRFAPAQGEVVLKVNTKDSDLIFQVLDSGPGIPASDLPFVFDRYYQSSANDQNQVVGGTGIGLAISKEYGALLGGALEVWNRKSGGACFQFVLPYTSVNEGDSGAPAAKSNPDYEASTPAMANIANEALGQSASALNKGEILIVEDHNDLRNYLKTVLKENGWKVQVAPHGQVALDYLNNCSPEAFPELIMTDMMMPVLSGEELVKALKKEKKFERIPLLILTAKTGQSDRLNMLHLGVDDYLTKPFSLEELLARINNLNRNHHNRKQAQQKYSTDDPNSEKEWLVEVETLILEHKADFDFSVNTLAEQLKMSRRQLYRKMHLESGLTPNEFIQEVKFREARNLLESKAVDTVKALSFAVGVKDVVNFSKNYKKRFGKLPSEYL